jgi:hypothetical protein
MSKVIVPALSSARLLKLCAAHGMDAAAVVDLLREAAGHGERKALECARRRFDLIMEAVGTSTEAWWLARGSVVDVDAALNRQQSFLSVLIADPGTTEEGLRRLLPEAIAKAREAHHAD